MQALRGGAALFDTIPVCCGTRADVNQPENIDANRQLY